MNKIIIGSISKPQGIKGEVKVTPLTDDTNRFKNLKSVYIDNVSYSVKSVRVLQNGVFLFLDGIDNRDKVEALRGKEIAVERSEAVSLAKDRYFIVDVVGCNVFVGNKKVGIVKEILQYGSADVYVVLQENKKTFMFPALKRILKEVNILEKKVMLNEESFDDLVVYED